MDEMEDKLSSILNNPEMMSQIMTMAQSLGKSTQSSPAAQPSQSQEVPKTAVPNFDPKLVQRIYGIASQSGIDKNQQALLKALSPYLTTQRINKLEKAMRAAKIAGLATTALNTFGIQLNPGR